MRSCLKISLAGFLLIFFSHAAQASGDVERKQGEIFDLVLAPWVDKWFSDHSVEVVLEDDLTIKRELVHKGLEGSELVQGKDYYIVKVLYFVDIMDRDKKLKVWGLKEQDIVFWMDGARVRDYYPLDDRWKERPRYTASSDTSTI